MGLTEAQDIKKRWLVYTELNTKDLDDPYNHGGVITHLESDLLKSEVMWPLGSITMNKLNMPTNLENSALARRLEKVSFHSNPKERQCQTMFKLPHNCTHLILARYVNCELPDYQAGFRKGRGTRGQIANIH